MTTAASRGAGQRVAEPRAGARRASGRSEGRLDWSSWPNYDSAALGLRGSWWYPVLWSSDVASKPVGVDLVGTKVVFDRGKGTVYALRDRCPHRACRCRSVHRSSPAPLVRVPRVDVRSASPGSCAPSSPTDPIRRSAARSAVDTYPVGRATRHGVDLHGREPRYCHRSTRPSPRSCASNRFSHGWVASTSGAAGWRFAAENGFDEGHAKYLHRTSLWRMFKVMPTWSRTL